MKYLHKFNSLEDFNAAYNGSDYHEPWVSLTKGELKISVIVNYSGDPEFVLRYVENASVTIDGDTVDAYIGQVESGNEATGYLDCYDGDYIATATKDDGTYAWDDENNAMIKVTKVGDQWSVPQGTYSHEIGKITTISTASKVDYNKQPIDYDLTLDTSEGSECDGRKITYFSDRIGPAEENYNENYGVYNYNVSNPNVTTNPVQSLKVNVINSDGYDGIHELPLTSSSESGNTGQIELESNALGLSVHVYPNDGPYVLSSVLTAGC